MIEHPCARGLTTDCFKTYPTWARQALAYKLLHILLPKQLAKNLPRNLNQPLIPPGIVWTPGDPLPPGAVIPPTVSPTPPKSGATPPLYISPSEPGPIGGPTAEGPAPYNRGYLLGSQNGIISGLSWGNDPSWLGYAAYIYFDINAYVAAVDIKIGTMGAPADEVILEIYNMVAEIGPTTVVDLGTASLSAIPSIPAFSIDQNYIRFKFTEGPLLIAGNKYGVAFRRTGGADLVNYFKAGFGVVGAYPIYRMDSIGVWHVFYDGKINLKVWGFPL